MGPIQLSILLTVLILSKGANLAAEAPNVVVILADDLGWNAVGYHNDEFVTPNIDRLVSEGVELNRFYVAPMCSPTRAGFLTGRYPIRFGCARAVIPPQRDFGLPNEETTIAEALERMGYSHRGVFGKWHLGHRRAKWHPLNQGFTHFHGHYNGAIDYFDLTREGERDWHIDYQSSQQQGYSTDLIADAAAQWITTAAKDSAPFFCYTAFNAPHSPFQAPSDAIEKFDHFRLDSVGSAEQDTEKNRKSTTVRGRKTKRNESIRQTYAAMIWKMDQGIGRILRAIEASGRSHNTIVWFFSDNGGVGNIAANNAPLRGSKLTVYEGGVRVPAAVRWPAGIQPATVMDEPCGYIDIMPTLIQAAGGQWDESTAKPLDGISVLPLLTSTDDGSVKKQIARRPWYSYHGQAGEQKEHLAVTAEGWKLKVNGPTFRKINQLSDGTNEVELFHLAADPLEKTNRLEDNPETANQLAQLLIEFRALQPEKSVPVYGVGKDGFVPPESWKLDPKYPNKLVGDYGDSSSK